MGILYRANQMKKNMKQQMILERLLELGVTHSKLCGKSVHELSYDELKVELVLAEMNQIDIESSEHKWFR